MALASGRKKRVCESVRPRLASQNSAFWSFSGALASFCFAPAVRHLRAGPPPQVSFSPPLFPCHILAASQSAQNESFETFKALFFSELKFIPRPCCKIFVPTFQASGFPLLGPRRRQLRPVAASAPPPAAIIGSASACGAVAHR